MPRLGQSEQLFVSAAIGVMHVQRPDDDRLFAECHPPGFAVTVPECGLLVNQTSECSAYHAPEDDGLVVVEPNNRVGLRPGNVKEEALVIAVQYPAIGVGKVVHRRSKLLGRKLSPIRLVKDRVSFDELDAKTARNFATQRRFP